MNIYAFFNSPDVAEYCQSIGHSFNAVESAVMISQSDSRTIAEKHAAYRAIIADYPDIKVPRGGDAYISSFHQALGDVIAYEEAILKRLSTPEPGAVYQANIYGCARGLFSNCDKALADAFAYTQGEEDAQESLDGEVFDYSRITINKKYIDPENEKTISAVFSRSGKMMSVRQTGVIQWDENDEYDVFSLLESIYIDIPIPFKRGDLVEVVGGHLFGRSALPYGGVYVLKDTCREYKRHEKMLYRSDLMDMTAEIFYEENGSVECEVMHFYPDLRYCRRELEGEKRILKYISLHMQDRLCLCSLLKIQKYLMLEEKASELKESYNLQYELNQIGDKLLEGSVANKEKLWNQGIMPIEP